jgi:hypothetical protein
MADDPLSAALAEIKHDHRQHVSVNFPAPGVCVSHRDRWPCQAYRAAAAVEAVLKLADNAKPTSFAAVWNGPIKPVAWNLDPEKLRAAVLAALTGKEADHGN